MAQEIERKEHDLVPALLTMKAAAEHNGLCESCQQAFATFLVVDAVCQGDPGAFWVCQLCSDLCYPVES